MAGDDDFRCGYVTLVGKPNVGKSTLLNRLLRKKLSIVTPKAQTTRHRILGILSEPAWQVIFLDTPGAIRPRTGLQQSMMRRMADAVAEADLLLFLADARADRPDTLTLGRVRSRPAILVVNKMDLLHPAEVLSLVDAYLQLRTFEAVVPVSALKGRNIDVLLEELTQRLPRGVPLYPADMISEHPERFFVSEIVREKLFERFRQEVPYSLAVNVSRYEENPGRKDFIQVDIVVERPSQKRILIGTGGRALKMAGVAARRDIEAFLGRAVYLKLYVQVRRNWRNEYTLLRSYGY